LVRKPFLLFIFFHIFISNLDRKKDLVKLRGGEYVSLTKVEMPIMKVPIIENCCLCASASSEYTVLLICPNVKNMAVSFIHFSFYCFIFFNLELYGKTFW
jgi:long-subunit acyl-CoA synthetase (AMP-forming)